MKFWIFNQQIVLNSGIILHFVDFFNFLTKIIIKLLEKRQISLNFQDFSDFDEILHIKSTKRAEFRNHITFCRFLQFSDQNYYQIA